MVDLVFGDLTLFDIGMAIATGMIAAVVLTTAYYMAGTGMPKWKPRKLVHTAMGTVVGLTLVGYSNLSGPAFAAGIFIFILFYSWAHKSELMGELLVAGSRDGESSQNTFMAGFMGMTSFGIVFLTFLSRPAIFVAAILAVAWGDAAGEVIGRPFGGRIIKNRYRNKSVEGSIGVFFFTVLAVLISLIVYSPGTVILLILPQIFLVALFSTIAEILSIGWTDNFFIPMITAIAMWLIIFPGIPLFIV
jgi:dolichol kinase